MSGPLRVFVLYSFMATCLSVEIFLSNLSPSCMLCLCQAASGCDVRVGCVDGFCGPYAMSQAYWTDALKPILPGDEHNALAAPAQAWTNCANNLDCSKQAVINYMIRYGQDCNRDGVTDCDDYAMINSNGGYECHLPLNRTDYGTAYLSRYNRCKAS